MSLGANHRAHSRENYSFAKGVSAWWKPDGGSEYLHLGALTGIRMIPREERYSHFTNVLGGRAKDLDIVTQRELAVSFNMEELNLPNYQLAMGSKEAATVGTRDIPFARVHKNPGAGKTIKLGQTGIKNVVARGPLLEGAEVLYDALSFAASGESAESNHFNNVTSPLTVVGAVTTYAGITFAVGKLYRLGTEIIRVTAIAGDDVTFARGQLGTTNAVHANGVAIEEGSGDYSVDLTTGLMTILWEGELDDAVAVPRIHVRCDKEVDVQEFKIWTGEALEGDFMLQRVGKSGAAWQLRVRGSMRNDGEISLGDGSAIDSIPMSIEALVDEGDDLGDFALVDQGELA